MDYTTEQLAAQFDIKLGQLTRTTWTENNVKELLRTQTPDVVRKIMCQHMKFAGIFTAGRQLVDWCYEVLNETI